MGIKNLMGVADSLPYHYLQSCAAPVTARAMDVFKADEALELMTGENG